MSEKNKQEKAEAAPDGAVEIPVDIEDGKEDKAEEACSSPAEDENSAIAEIARLECELAAKDAALVKALEAVKETQMRTQAEFENYKKRLAREHDDHVKYAAKKVMEDLLPTLDNLELAINYGSRDAACADMMKGVEMTQKLLLEAVGRYGLEKVGARGEVFDPAMHEAVGFDSCADLENDAVARVMQSGYRLAGRLLRPAKVMVNRK